MRRPNQRLCLKEPKSRWQSRSFLKHEAYPCCSGKKQRPLVHQRMPRKKCTEEGGIETTPKKDRLVRLMLDELQQFVDERHF